MQIRPVDEADLSILAQLWEEKSNLLQQTQEAYPKRSRSDWLNYAHQCLVHSACGFFVAVKDSQLVGYIISWVQELPIFGMEKQGIISELVTDLHQSHPRLGRQLVQCVMDWLAEQGISTILVCIPRGSMVEQAFWESMGVKRAMDIVWLDR